MNSTNYYQVIDKTIVDVKSIVIEVAGKKIKLSGDEAKGLRDFLLGAFPTMQSTTWTSAPNSIYYYSDHPVTTSPGITWSPSTCCTDWS